MTVIKFLLKLLLLGGLYVVALYHYAPSDVTEAAWLLKISTLIFLARIFAVFLLYCLIKFIFFSKGKSFFGRLLGALFALPFYAIVTLLIALCINGYNDNKEHTTSWKTNLVYFKSFNIACIAAAIDDEQLHNGDRSPRILLLPGALCASLVGDAISGEALTPYQLELSSGALGIPYAVAVQKL